MTDRPPAPEPDDKDWTWTLQRACPDCGFDAPTLDRADLPRLTRAYVAELDASLDRPDATTRSRPQVWSPAEYACHVRDVCSVFGGRLASMIGQDDPLFANWDQDVTAIQERYWEQPVATVRPQLAAAAEAIGAQWAAVTQGQWTRPGRRSNGSVFTVDTLGRYFLHDLAHHAWDVRPVDTVGGSV